MNCMGEWTAQFNMVKTYSITRTTLGIEGLQKKGIWFKNVWPPRVQWIILRWGKSCFQFSFLGGGESRKS
jgi:hypothetical protein